MRSEQRRVTGQSVMSETGNRTGWPTLKNSAAVPWLRSIRATEWFREFNRFLSLPGDPLVISHQRRRRRRRRRPVRPPGHKRPCLILALLLLFDYSFPFFFGIFSTLPRVRTSATTLPSHHSPPRRPPTQQCIKWRWCLHNKLFLPFRLVIFSPKFLQFGVPSHTTCSRR